MDTVFAHLQSHAYTIVGVIVSTAGAVLLVYFPPGAKGYQPDGSWHGWWATPATDDGKRRYKLYTFGFWSSIVCIIVGSMLVVVDLLL